jgi:hypothetical protein
MIIKLYIYTYILSSVAVPVTRATSKIVGATLNSIEDKAKLMDLDPLSIMRDSWPVFLSR